MKIPKWRIIKKNFITLSFFFVVMSMEKFSWLISREPYIIPGFLKVSDIGVLAAIAWIIYVMFIVRTKQKIKYSIFPALFVVMIIVSSFAAYSFFGQGFGLTIRQNRYIIISMLLYYAIIKALKTGHMLRTDVISIIAFQAVVEIILFTLQYIMIDTVTFIYVNVDSRYGETRMRVSYLLALIFMYICIDRILNNKYKMWNFFLAIGGVFVLVVISKNRTPSVIMLGTFVAAFLLWKKGSATKFFVGIMVGIIAVAFIVNSTLFQDVLAIVGGAPRDVLGVRHSGQFYYIEALAKSPLIGFGEPNENCIAATLASGEHLNYFLADNGIIGFFYSHGIMGLIWLIFFWVKMVKESYYLFKKKNMYQYILYVIFETGNLYIGMHWYHYYAMPFVLIITLMSYDYSNAIEEKAIKAV